MLQNSIKTNAFMGTTGEVVLDGNQDRLGNYDVYTMSATSVTKVATWSALEKTLNITGNFVFAGGRTTIPIDGPYGMVLFVYCNSLHLRSLSVVRER